MLRIGICDDDREYREKIHDLVIHSIFSYDDAQVVHYMSGKQVVDDIEKEEFEKLKSDVKKILYNIEKLFEIFGR